MSEGILVGAVEGNRVKGGLLRGSDKILSTKTGAQDVAILE